MNNRRRLGNVSLAQLLVAAGLASAVTLIVAKLSQSTSDTARRSTDAYATVEMRDAIVASAKDPSKWLEYQLRADALNDGSVLSNCLNPGGPYVCGPSESDVDPLVLLEAQGRAVTSVNLYTHKRAAAPSALSSADFARVGGLTEVPAYFDKDGAACSGADNLACVRRVVAYMVRQNTGTNVDPGAIVFIVRMDQNPATAAVKPNLLQATYTRINVGLLWKGDGESPVPVGSVMPYIGPESSLPEGYLMCDGRKYNAADYPNLAAILKNRWTPPGAAAPGGGEFYVPDLRGTYLRGADGSRTVGSFQAQNADASHIHGATNVPLSNVTFPSPSSFTRANNAVSGIAMSVAGAFASYGWKSGYSIFGCGGQGQGINSGVSTGTATLSRTGPIAALTAASGSLTTTGSCNGVMVSDGTVFAGRENRSPSTYTHYIIRAEP